LSFNLIQLDPKSTELHLIVVAAQVLDRAVASPPTGLSDLGGIGYSLWVLITRTE
jgi:hypothetical protein